MTVASFETESLHTTNDDAVDDTGANEAPHTPSPDSNNAHRLLRQLGNRWTFPILGALQQGPMRFAKLKRVLEPVSQRMLTLSLRKLEQDRLVYREKSPGQPPQVRYGLTALGGALVVRLADFENWLEMHGGLPEQPKKN